MAYAFDTLRFIQRLEQVGVGREQAVAHAELARDMIPGGAASKDDIGNLRHDVLHLRDDMKRDVAGLKKDIGDLEARIGGQLRELELRMTVKLGAIVVAAMAAIAAVQKFP
jgi:hypothetical protein